jgi:membrane associated rhomboid family serine protease
VVPALIAVNILVHVVLAAIESGDPAGGARWRGLGILFPGEAGPGAPDWLGQGFRGFAWWNLLTYQFLHADWLHLLGNMLFLWVFGPNVEDRFGRWRFLAFYLLGGCAAGGLHVLFENAPVLGASGSVAAVSGAFLVFFPLVQVRVLIIFLFIGVFELTAWWLIAAQFFWDFVLQGMGSGGRVARLAHLGGYGFGALTALVLLWTRLVPHEPFDLFGMAKHAGRRRALKEAMYEYGTRTARGGRSGEGAESHGGQGSPSGDDLRLTLSAARAAKNLRAAAAAYARLRERAAVAVGEDEGRLGSGRGLLAKQQHLDFGNELMAAEMHAEAARVYADFLSAWPKERQSDEVRLLLALVRGRYLGQRAEAAALLAGVEAGGLTAPLQGLLGSLREEFGGDGGGVGRGREPARGAGE